MDNKYYVYRHIRLDTNQPFYIGVGSGKRDTSTKSRNIFWHNITNKTEYRVEKILLNLTYQKDNLLTKLVYNISII